MTAERFTLDANILVYAASPQDARQAAAQEIIDRALRSGNALLTLQALGEFHHVTVRKRLASPIEAMQLVENWHRLFGPPWPPSFAAMRRAMAAVAARRFSYWDALLLATAAEAGCTALLTEDMAPDALLGNIRVVPAFADGAISLAAAALLAT